MHTLLLQASPASQPMHGWCTPHPRLTGPQPVTMPASMASAHVEGVQHVPALVQTPVVPQPEPQLMLWPQAFSAVPHTAPPQEGGVQVVQVLPTQWVPVAHPGHWTFPLPHAFRTDPHVELVHSGGAGLHTPPMHCCPLGHEQLSVWLQGSSTTPHRCVLLSGVQVSGAHDAEASIVT